MKTKNKKIKAEKEPIFTQAYRLQKELVGGEKHFLEVKCFADSIYMARRLVWAQVKDLDLTTYFDGKKVDVLNVPVVRMVGWDKHEYNGKLLSPCEIIEEINRLREEKTSAMIKDDSVTHCYIQKNGLYYLPACLGYTPFISKAAVFFKKEAILFMELQEKENTTVDVIPVNKDIHNSELLKTIEDIQSRLL